MNTSEFRMILIFRIIELLRFSAGLHTLCLKLENPMMGTLPMMILLRKWNSGGYILREDS